LAESARFTSTLFADRRFFCPASCFGSVSTNSFDGWLNVDYLRGFGFSPAWDQLFPRRTFGEWLSTYLWMGLAKLKNRSFRYSSLSIQPQKTKRNLYADSPFNFPINSDSPRSRAGLGVRFLTFGRPRKIFISLNS
jgi:hypothetical protein